MGRDFMPTLRFAILRIRPGRLTAPLRVRAEVRGECDTDFAIGVLPGRSSDVLLASGVRRGTWLLI
jgi:hypothetical protein